MKLKVTVSFSAKTDVEIDIPEDSDIDYEIYESLCALEKDASFINGKDIRNINIDAYEWDD